MLKKKHRNENSLFTSFFVAIFLFSFILFFTSFPTLTCATSSLACSPCSTSLCKCATNCSSGYFSVYPTSSCSGLPAKKIIIDYNNVSFAPTGTAYVKILCSDDNSVSQCYTVTPTTQQTTTTTTAAQATTTTTTLATCPYECCVSKTGYKNKFCDSGQTCTNNVCVTSNSDCPNECCAGEANYTDKFCNGDASCVEGKCIQPGPIISYSLIGIIAAIVVIAVLAFFFLRGQFSTKTDSYEELKKKWGKRKLR